jgi:hypothetical protein
MVQLIGSKKATTCLKKITGRMSDNLCREAAYLKCARLNCSGDGRRPTEAGFQEQASNRPELLW